MFHLRFGLSDHLKALLDFVFGSRRRVKKVRIFRAWFSHILIYYVVGRTHYQAVLIAEESVVNGGGKGENRLWKRVTPTVTEFAWLPPNIAESFCRNALYRVTERTYHAFDIPHLGLDTTSFVADVFVEGHFVSG